MTTISTQAASLAQAERLKKMQMQMATLQQQLTTQKKTNLFKGLGVDASPSARYRASLDEINTYSQNIDIADRRIKLMSQGLTSFKQQAGNISSALTVQLQRGEYEMDSVADLARKTEESLRDILNLQDGDRFLFGGSETLTRPITDTGTDDTFMIKNLEDWINGTITTDQMIASYTDRTQLNDTLMGYSAPLSGNTTKGVSVRVEGGAEIDYTILADDDGFRDVMAVVGMLKNIGEVMDKVALDAGDPPGTVTAPGATPADQAENFYKLFNDLAAKVAGALDRINVVEYNLSNSSARLSQVGAEHKLDKNVLEQHISDIEDVDLNEVAVKIQSLGVQLEASYNVTAMMRDISLVYYLR